MKTTLTTKKIGGSIMIIIPKELVEAENIGENQKVDVEIKKSKISGFGILKGMESFTKEDELNTHD